MTRRDLLLKKKILKQSLIICYVVRFLLWLKLLFKNISYTYHDDSKKVKNKQFLLLSDHSARNNFQYIYNGFFKYGIYPIIGYQNFFSGGLFSIMRSFGAIPKLLYEKDIQAVKKTFDVKSRGYSLWMFPEGIQSMCGFMQPINPATPKLIKKLGLDVILATTKGTYFLNNRYSKNHTKGNVRIDYYHLFTKEELSRLSEEEIYIRLYEKMRYNDFKWNEEQMNKYMGVKNKDIEKILFYCPNCQNSLSLYSTNEYFGCNKCKNKWYLDNYYRINTLTNGTDCAYKRLDKWFLREREIVKEEVSINNYEFTYDARYVILNDEINKRNPYSIVDSGKVSITSDKIEFAGDRYKLSFDINLIPSFIFYNNNDTVNHNYFYYEGRYYGFIPNDYRLCTKLMMIVEELYFKKNPSWKKVADDAFWKEF